jgi:AP-3 complex subunit beta
MSGQQYLNVLSENATRLGMRLSEHTRELGATMTRAGGMGLGAAGAGAGGRGAAYLDAGGSTDKDRERIRKQLESSSDREKLDAMRKLVGVS